MWIKNIAKWLTRRMQLLNGVIEKKKVAFTKKRIRVGKKKASSAQCPCGIVLYPFSSSSFYWKEHCFL